MLCSSRLSAAVCTDAACLAALLTIPGLDVTATGSNCRTPEVHAGAYGKPANAAAIYTEVCMSEPVYACVCVHVYLEMCVCLFRWLVGLFVWSPHHARDGLRSIQNSSVCVFVCVCMYMEMCVCYRYEELVGLCVMCVGWFDRV